MRCKYSVIFFKVFGDLFYVCICVMFKPSLFTLNNTLTVDILSKHQFCDFNPQFGYWTLIPAPGPILVNYM